MRCILNLTLPRDIQHVLDINNFLPFLAHQFSTASLLRLDFFPPRPFYCLDPFAFNLFLESIPSFYVGGRFEERFPFIPIRDKTISRLEGTVHGSSNNSRWSSFHPPRN